MEEQKHLRQPVENETISGRNGERHISTWIHSGVLHISGLTVGESWRIYNILGAHVYQGIASSDQAEVKLPARGIYLIVTGATILKVIH